MAAIYKGGKKAAAARWYAKNAEREKVRMKKYRMSIRSQVFAAYGGPVCICCGEKNLKFLSVDHMHNDGAKHRKEIGHRGGIGWYRWLVQNDFPDGFQILCFNCNLGRAHNGGICPHKDTNKMAKMKANPLGHLELEMVHNFVNGVSDSNYTEATQSQAPVHSNASGNETFREDAKKPSSRADVEKRRMHIDSGADLKGVDMSKEFGGGDKGAKDFSSDKSA